MSGLQADVDVVVVGAGFAGLSAARDLVAAGNSVAVLEARDRVGGRTRNIEIDRSGFVEAGGQWVGPKQNRVLALAAEFERSTFPTYYDGAHITVVDGERIEHETPLAPRNPAAVRAIEEAIEHIDRAAELVPLERPWEAPNAADLDTQTFVSWLAANIANEDARSYVDAYISGTESTPPGEVSALQALFTLHSSAGFESISAIPGGSLQSRVTGGLQGLAVQVADALGDRVVFNSPVRRIEQRVDGVRVYSDAGIHDARRVVIAVPPVLAIRIDYDPPLPPLHDAMLSRILPGAVIKVHVIYDEPFWRADGFSGQALELESPFDFCLDNSPPDGSYGAIVGFFDLEMARRYGGESIEARREVVLGTLERWFGPRAAKAEQYIDTDWSAEPWTKGCFAGKLRPGGWMSFGPTMRKPAGRLHWAATEFAVRWNGYVDGAIESGRRAAAEIVEAFASGPTQR